MENCLEAKKKRQTGTCVSYNSNRNAISSTSWTCKWRPASQSIKPRTTDTRRVFFKNLKLFSLGRQIGLKFNEAFQVLSAELSAPILALCVPCPCFPLINHFSVFRYNRADQFYEWQILYPVYLLLSKVHFTDLLKDSNTSQ